MEGLRPQCKAVNGSCKGGWRVNLGGYEAGGGHLGTAGSEGSGMDTRSRRGGGGTAPPFKTRAGRGEAGRGEASLSFGRVFCGGPSPGHCVVQGLHAGQGQGLV